MTPRRTTRRRFLADASAITLAGLGAAVVGCDRGRDDRVVIVGGGLAGLATLDWLARAGRRAVLLEASSRLGGRILTRRDGLRAGLRAELGAERVGIEDRSVRALVSELGLAMAPYEAPRLSMVLRWKGREHRFGTSRDLPNDVLAGMSDVERGAAPFGVLHALVDRVSPPSPDDARTGIEWLRAAGMTAAGEEFVRAFTALPLESMPAAVLHRAAVREARARQSDTIAGGSDRLVDALAARHPDAIVRGAAIASVRQGGRGVVVTDREGRAFEGSHAVLCLPLGPLRALSFEGGAPEPLVTRMGALAIGHETKAAIESTDAATAFTFGPREVSWRMPESAGAAFVRQTLTWSMGATTPETRAWPSGTLVHDFSSDPLVGGAYAYARSGLAARGIVRAERVIVAGGDLSDAPGWMEGALRSAKEAVAALG